MEFVVSNHIKVHPMALVHFDRLEDQDAKRTIAQLTQGYADKTQYFVDRLARGLARIAAAHHPKPVIVRMSDFKTNEYANLIGGMAFEPKEENPMLGFRGASRYYSPRYRDGFRARMPRHSPQREGMGFGNVVVMIPFCRSTKEAEGGRNDRSPERLPGQCHRLRPVTDTSRSTTPRNGLGPCRRESAQAARQGSALV